MKKITRTIKATQVNTVIFDVSTMEAKTIKLVLSGHIPEDKIMKELVKYYERNDKKIIKIIDFVYTQELYELSEYDFVRLGAKVEKK